MRGWRAKGGEGSLEFQYGLERWLGKPRWRHDVGTTLSFEEQGKPEGDGSSVRWLERGDGALWGDQSWFMETCDREQIEVVGNGIRFRGTYSRDELSRSGCHSPRGARVLRVVVVGLQSPAPFRKEMQLRAALNLVVMMMP